VTALGSFAMILFVLGLPKALYANKIGGAFLFIRFCKQVCTLLNKKALCFRMGFVTALGFKPKTF
jgi:hypothetical protein